MPYIKNVPHEAIFSLADQVRVQPGQVVSKTLAQNDAVSVTLLPLQPVRRSAPMIPPATLWLPCWRVWVNSLWTVCPTW